MIIDIRLNDWIAALLLLVVAISPLPLGSNRPIFWTISAMFVFATMAIFLFGHAYRGRNFAIGLKNLGWLGIIVGLYLAYITLQIIAPFDMIASFTPRASLLGLIRTLSYVCFFFMMVQVFANYERARRFLRYFSILPEPMRYSGFCKYLATLGGGNGPNETAYEGNATGPFINRNSFATYLGFSLLLGLANLVIRLRELGKRGASGKFRKLDFLDVRVSINIAILAIMLVTLVSTNSRMGVAAYLCAAVGFLLFWVFKRNDRHPGRLALLTLIVFIFAIYAFYLYGGTLMERLGSVENDADVRFDLYEQVWGMILTNPFSGYGMDSFEIVFQGFHQSPVSPDLVWDKPHNTYLTNWVETGLFFGSIPGIAALLLFGQYTRVILTRRRNIVFPLLGCAVLLQGAIHSLVDFSLEIQANMYLLLAILALASASALQENRERVR